jgi:hypothetical protein
MKAPPGPGCAQPAPHGGQENLGRPGVSLSDDASGQGEDGLRQALQRKGSFWQTVKAVGWSFFGIRRGTGYEQDVQKLNPLHVVVAGLAGAALFIVLLVVLVKWVVSSGVAAR